MLRGFRSGGEMSATAIRDALETLTLTDRLDASAIQNLSVYDEVIADDATVNITPGDNKINPALTPYQNKVGLANITLSLAAGTSTDISGTTPAVFDNLLFPLKDKRLTLQGDTRELAGFTFLKNDDAIDHDAVVGNGVCSFTISTSDVANDSITVTRATANPVLTTIAANDVIMLYTVLGGWVEYTVASQPVANKIIMTGGIAEAEADIISVVLKPNRIISQKIQINRDCEVYFKGIYLAGEVYSSLEGNSTQRYIVRNTVHLQNVICANQSSFYGDVVVGETDIDLPSACLTTSGFSVQEGGKIYGKSLCCVGGQINFDEIECHIDRFVLNTNSDFSISQSLVYNCDIYTYRNQSIYISNSSLDSMYIEGDTIVTFRNTQALGTGLNLSFAVDPGATNPCVFVLDSSKISGVGFIASFTGASKAYNVPINEVQPDGSILFDENSLVTVYNRDLNTCTMTCTELDAYQSNRIINDKVTVSRIIINVTQAYDGTPVLTAGTANDADAFITAADAVDLTSTGMTVLEVWRASAEVSAFYIAITDTPNQGDMTVSFEYGRKIDLDVWGA